LLLGRFFDHGRMGHWMVGTVSTGAARKPGKAGHSERSE
jgi:hypothetical protein